MDVEPDGRTAPLLGGGLGRKEYAGRLAARARRLAFHLAGSVVRPDGGPAPTV